MLLLRHKLALVAVAIAVAAIAGGAYAATQSSAPTSRQAFLDDVAKRLDPQSLAAAKLAIQTFTPEPQPEDAINVATPPGGWDRAPVPVIAAKPAAKPASTKRVAR